MHAAEDGGARHHLVRVCLVLTAGLATVAFFSGLSPTTAFACTPTNNGDGTQKCSQTYSDVPCPSATGAGNNVVADAEEFIPAGSTVTNHTLTITPNCNNATVQQSFNVNATMPAPPPGEETARLDYTITCNTTPCGPVTNPTTTFSVDFTPPGGSNGGGGMSCAPPDTGFTKCADFAASDLSATFHLSGPIDFRIDDPARPVFLTNDDELSLTYKVSNAGPDTDSCTVASIPPSVDPLPLLCGPPINYPAGDSATIFNQVYPLPPSAAGTLSLAVKVTPASSYDPDAFNNTSAPLTLSVGSFPGEHPRIASAGAGGAAGSLTAEKGRSLRASGVKRVEVAIMDTGAGKCRWLKSVDGGLTQARDQSGCDPPTWLRAAGTNRWSLNLRRDLPKGKYIFIARAFNSARNASGGFTQARKTLRLVTVK